MAGSPGSVAPWCGCWRNLALGHRGSYGGFPKSYGCHQLSELGRKEDCVPSFHCVPVAVKTGQAVASQLAATQGVGRAHGGGRAGVQHSTKSPEPPYPYGLGFATLMHSPAVSQSSLSALRPPQNCQAPQEAFG